MTLSQTEKKRFRKIGHNLKPVVTIAGKGFSASVKKEVLRALADHELIKIKLNVEDNNEEKDLLAKIDKGLGSETSIVQSVGHTALLFCPAAKPNAKLSNLLRKTD